MRKAPSHIPRHRFMRREHSCAHLSNMSNKVLPPSFSIRRLSIGHWCQLLLRHFFAALPLTRIGCHEPVMMAATRRRRAVAAWGPCEDDRPPSRHATPCRGRM